MINEINKMKKIVICTIFFMVLLSVKTQALEEANIITFGAVGNDLIDDTDSIQSAIDFQSEDGGGGIVYFPKGNYLVDAVKSIILKDNITLSFEKGAILKVLPNNAEKYEVIEIHDNNNVEIIGDLEIQGERDEHLGIAGEWGFGISIKGSNNILIENVNISNSWGDAIYIGSTPTQNYSQNVKIIKPVLKYNRRQGISIISAKNLEIRDAIITDTQGTPPQNGIDIEPNFFNEHLENIKIINLNTKNNEKYGLQIYLKKIEGTGNRVNISVDSTINIKDGVSVSDFKGVQGVIIIGGYYYLSNEEIIAPPILNTITNSTTIISGFSLPQSLVTINIDGKIMGSVKTDANGNFAIPITKQNIGSTIVAMAKDSFGNESKETEIHIQAEKYSDVIFSNWFYKEVLSLSDKGIINGYPSGTFSPNKNITRAEAAKMLSEVMNLPGNLYNNQYPDVKNSHWAKDEIAAVTTAGLFSGYPNGNFEPEKSMTRAELAKVLTIAFTLEKDNKKVFTDVPTSYWAFSSISALSKNKITTGFPDNTFRPKSGVTRAEFSVFIFRTLEVSVK